MEKFLGEYYTADELEYLADILENPPLYTSLRINTLKCTKAEALLMLCDHFKSVNESFLVEANEDFPDVLMIKANGPNQVSSVAKEIVVDCSSGASLLRGADLYAAGIIGMSESISSGDLVSVWADLEGKCPKGHKKAYFGRTKFIGNGICQLDRFQVFGENSANTSGIGVKMTEMVYKMPSLNSVLTEFIFLQNIPSVSVGKLLNPRPNSRILDMCAAPGGKTCHLAAITNNTSEIFAFDRIPKKVKRIIENCNLLGAKNVHATVADSSMLIEKKVFEPESFDYILLDPPCSGLGLRPNLKFSLTDDFSNLDSFAPFQRKLFKQAWGLLKPGGEMTYSTCTINPLENEVLLDKMLKVLPNAEVLPIREGFMEKYCLPGLKIGSLTEDICNRCICRFWPSLDRDSNGFFLVKLRKKLNNFSIN